MEAISQDLRDRVVRACDASGAIRRDIAKRFSVSESFIRKLMQRRRDTGSFAAKPHSGGSRPKVRPEHLPQIQGLVQEQSDATLLEYCNRLEQRQQVRVSDSTMSRILQKLKLPRKKSRCTPANGRASG